MNIRVIEQDILSWLESIRTDALSSFIEMINFTGDILFFTIMLPIVYWLFSKRLGLILALSMFASLFINIFLKDIFEILRPFQAFDITSIINQTGYSFPSGHAQHSFVFWITLALFLRKKWFWPIAIIMVILIGFARMYSGVHYPLDVLGGWFIAGLVIFGFSYINKHQLLFTINKRIVLSCGVVIAGVELLLYEIFATNPLDQKGAYQAAGLLLFSIIGFILEQSYVKFEIKRTFIYKICALIFGLLGLLLIKEGVKVLLPEQYWSDLLRYGLLGLWTIYIAPALFVVFRLAYKKL